MGFTMFNILELLFPVIFIAGAAVIVFIIVLCVKQWAHNNSQPSISAEALVVTKRTSDTTHYVTFEFDSGDRQEFYVPAHKCGLIAEGDSGTLTSQGTRFISFERHR